MERQVALLQQQLAAVRVRLGGARAEAIRLVELAVLEREGGEHDQGPGPRRRARQEGQGLLRMVARVGRGGELEGGAGQVGEQLGAQVRAGRLGEGVAKQLRGLIV